MLQNEIKDSACVFVCISYGCHQFLTATSLRGFSGFPTTFSRYVTLRGFGTEFSRQDSAFFGRKCNGNLRISQ